MKGGNKIEVRTFFLIIGYCAIVLAMYKLSSSVLFFLPVKRFLPFTFFVFSFSAIISVLLAKIFAKKAQKTNIHYMLSALRFITTISVFLFLYLKSRENLVIFLVLILFFYILNMGLEILYLLGLRSKK